MGLPFLEHLLILTHDPDATRDWYVRKLGFREGPHPEFGFPACHEAAALGRVPAWTDAGAND